MVRGLAVGAQATVIQVQWLGSEAVEVTHKDPRGRVGFLLLFGGGEARLEVVE